MHTKSRLFTAASIVAVASTAASPAMAAGTQSGTPIQNTVTVNYSVGGVQQTATSGSDTFVVDRKIMLTVSESGGSATTVAPNQQDAVTTFTVTNSSNDTLDFLLAATNDSGGAGKFGGTDSFNVGNLRMYRETDAQAGLQLTGPNADVLITDYLDEVGPDQFRTVYVVGNIPNPQANGTKATVTLTATAASGGGANSKGSALQNDNTAANVAGTVQNVFADDPNLPANAGRYDGVSFDKDDYLVAAALISAAKSSVLLWDPVNGTNNPKMIPGAVIEYCIAVANGSGAATATGVTLSDEIPTETAYLPSGTVASGTGVAANTGIGVIRNGGGTLSGTTATCTSATGESQGTFTANTRPAKDVVGGTLSDIAAGAVRTLRFRVVVN